MSTILFGAILGLLTYISVVLVLIYFCLIEIYKRLDRLPKRVIGHSNDGVVTYYAKD